MFLSTEKTSVTQKRPDIFASTVNGLCALCGPTAIPRFVVSFIVDTIKRKPFWTWAEDVEKLFKRSKVESYTSPAVPSERTIFRIVTAAFRTCKDIVFWKMFASARSTMPKSLLLSEFSAVTAATLSMPVDDFIAAEVGKLTAIAAASPKWMPSMSTFFYKADHCKLSESLACQIF